MKKIIFTSVAFIASIFFGFAQIEDCSELFITEYVEGTGKNQVIELYNPSDITADLSQYSIKCFASGPNNPNVVQLSGTLPIKGRTSCGNSQADPNVLVLCDFVSSELKFDGDDAVGLYKNDVLIDMIGEIGVNPGNNGWQVGAGFTKNNTLRRGYDVRGPTAYWTQSVFEWDVLPIDEVGGLGDHDGVCSDGATAFFKTNNNVKTVSEGVGTVWLPLKVGSSLNIIADGKMAHNPDMQCIDPIEAIHNNDYTTPNSPNTLITFQVPANAPFETDPVTPIAITIIDDKVHESEDEIICIKIATTQNVTPDDNPGQLRWDEYQIIIEDNDWASGIEEQMQKNVKVYPTITYDKLFIDMKKYIGEVEIDVYNSFGQLVKSIADNELGGTVELDVQELSRGMYIISLEGKEWYVTKKFVKN